MIKELTGTEPEVYTPVRIRREHGRKWEMKTYYYCGQNTFGFPIVDDGEGLVMVVYAVGLDIKANAKRRGRKKRLSEEK